MTGTRSRPAFVARGLRRAVDGPADPGDQVVVIDAGYPLLFERPTAAFDATCSSQDG